MAKFASDDLIDNGPKYLVDNADQLNINDGEPTTYSEATSGSKFLGSTSLSASDLSLADGDTSGRKATTAAQSGVSLSSGGDWDHISWVDTGTSSLLAVTTRTSVVVTSGQTVDVPAIDYEVQDPE